MYGRKEASSPLEWNDTTSLKVQPRVSIGVLVNLIQQAYESACTYWVDDVDAVKRRVFVGQDLKDFKHVYSFVAVCDDPLGDGVTRYGVDVNTVKSGIELVLNGKSGARADLVAQVHSVLTDDVDIDDEACDVIVQCGLFGEIIFG